MKIPVPVHAWDLAGGMRQGAGDVLEETNENMASPGLFALVSSPANVINSTPSTMAAAKPEITGPGRYYFTARTGSSGVIGVPGRPVAEIEELRAIVAAGPVTYITVHVDNRQGTEPIDMFSVSIFTPDGEELKYRNASDYIDELRARVPFTCACTEGTGLYCRKRIPDAGWCWWSDRSRLGGPR